MGWLVQFGKWIYNLFTKAFAKVTLALAVLSSAVSAIVTLWGRVVSVITNVATQARDYISQATSNVAAVSSGTSGNEFLAIVFDLFGLDYLVSVVVSCIDAAIANFVLWGAVIGFFFTVFAIVFTYKWAVRIIRVASLSTVDAE